VTFEPAEWPSLKFHAPQGKAWDWSASGFLLLDLKNAETEPLELGIRIDDNPAADGRQHCRTAQVKLSPHESATVAVALASPDPMALGMRGLPQPQGRAVRASGQGPFQWSHVVAFQIFMHQPRIARSVEIGSGRLAPPISMAGIVDSLGQYAGANWPGKLLSESELASRHEQETRELAAHPAMADRDRFGGWRTGPKQPAAGFFRTVKLDGKWWLVDPDGAPFFSLGIDVVAPHEATMITGRESMFQSLPHPGDDPLARHFGSARQVHSGPVKSGRTFNFYAANLERLYGTTYLERWKESTLTRLPSWGFNTIGNWSDHRLYGNGRVPYVATVSIGGSHARVGSGSDYWGKMHDPFDPRFAEDVRASLQAVVARIKGDPWCLGTFVDNELSWGGFGDEGGRIGLGLGALKLPAASSPAKRALVYQLRKQYGDIGRLNAAWKTSLSDWQALQASWQPDPSSTLKAEAFKTDLRNFVKELARAYFRTVRDELKAADPDHLYLGCRFAWRTDEAVAAASEFCDVVSFNIYDRRVDPAKWAFLNTLDRPVIIGEFHAGALDRGMFHTGLVSAADQAERAEIYADYVASVLDNPALVGCHWFQYIDEPLTGRSFDGENYNIGFLTITDTVYPELLAAARKVHAETYARRSATKAGR
jgi:hypothetical protein